MTKHPVVIAGLLLGMFSVIGTGLVAFTYEQTADRIAANEREALLNKLHALVPPESIDNDLIADRITVASQDRLGGRDISVYRARKKGMPVALVLAPIVPDGYSGPIKLLVAVRFDGTLGGVRVVSHKETPGLGDKVEEERSDWILDFNKKSLGDPPLSKWYVKRDGGVFDQFTGATVTPRSIVKAVKNTLLYVKEQRDILYDTRPIGPESKIAGGG